MRMSVKSLLAAALVMMAGTFCYGADQIDNPEYKGWSKFKAGTTVTLKTESESGAEMPPPGDGLETLTGFHPRVVKDDAGTTAVN